MKQIFISILFLIIFLFSALVPAQAQNSGVEENSGAEKILIDANSQGFFWWMLLPLLTIPFLFLFWREAPPEEEDSEYPRIQGFVGAKGGRTEKNDRKKENNTTPS